MKKHIACSYFDGRTQLLLILSVIFLAFVIQMGNFQLLAPGLLAPGLEVADRFHLDRPFLKSLAEISGDTEFSQLLSVFSPQPIQNETDLKSALYKMYEVKGHPINAAGYALVLPDKKDTSRRDIDAWGHIDSRKRRRNAVIGRTYGFSPDRMVSDYSKGWRMVQSALLDDIQIGNGFNGTAFRFGGINGAYDFSTGVRTAAHFSSASAQQALWVDSYFERAINGTSVSIYKINSENCGVDLSWALDKSINPDSRIGTKEVVFPSGTHFVGEGTTRYRIGPKLKRLDLDIFNGNMANILFQFTLIDPLDKSKTMPLKALLKTYSTHPLAQPGKSLFDVAEVLPEVEDELSLDLIKFIDMHTISCKKTTPAR